MKFVKWITILIMLLLLLLIVGLHILNPMMMGKEDTAQNYFNPLNVSFEEHEKVVDGRSVHFVETGNPKAQNLIVFIHGAPGSWQDFNSYLADSILRSQFRMIAIDRPGYGFLEAEDLVFQIPQQAAILENVIYGYEQDSIVVIGYSYGGPVAGLMAANGKYNYKKLILLSPAIAAEAEPLFWFNDILNNKLIYSLMPRFIRSSNDEKTSHALALDQIESEWSKIQCPVYHVHSKEDWIAPYIGNSTYSEERVNPQLLRLITLESDPHFLPNDKLGFVRALIVE